MRSTSISLASSFRSKWKRATQALPLQSLSAVTACYCMRRMPIYTRVKTVRKTMPVSGCGLRTVLGELHSYKLIADHDKVVDCGQTLVSYTWRGCGCRMRCVVDCGQTLVSYTCLSAATRSYQVVDCGQTLVSYTKTPRPADPPSVVDCGQTLVSYTPTS